MGFLKGVITGVAVAAGTAAWYLSRTGQRSRDQFHVERRLGEFGGQLESRTREIQSSVNAQLAEMRARHASAAIDVAPIPTLDAARASAAESAAEAAAEVEAAAASDDDAPTRRTRKASKDAASAE
ncbi:MAG: hypothetical protein ABIQ58_05280 [Candidatus Limnocylindrales bacterium]